MVDYGNIMGSVIRLAGLLSGAHARAVSEYLFDNVVGLASDEERDAAIVKMVGIITSEMVNGPIAMAEMLGVTPMIGVYLPDGEEVRERNETFDGITYTADGFAIWE